MVQKVEKVIAVSTEVPDQAGTVAGMAAVLREQGIGVKAVWACSAGTSTVMIVSIPQEIEPLRRLAAQEGRTIKETPMVWIEGPDETGALCSFLTRVGQAGISIHAMVALATVGSFAGVFEFADGATVDRVVALFAG